MREFVSDGFYFLGESRGSYLWRVRRFSIGRGWARGSAVATIWFDRWRKQRSRQYTVRQMVLEAGQR